MNNMTYQIKENAKNVWIRNNENTQDLSPLTDANSVYFNNGRTLEQELGRGVMESNIVTVNSSTHWQGLYKDVKNYIKDNDLEIHVTNKKSPDGDDWNLIDLGPIVIHLMSEAARSFYDLEKLWFNGKKLEF